MSTIKVIIIYGLSFTILFIILRDYYVSSFHEKGKLRDKLFIKKE